jgi:biopolymer transport protein ExbD
MNLRPHRRRVPIIPIVSMIDILVILLIFFIATTTFRGKPKTHLKISLPESQAMGATAAQAETRTAITISKEQKLFLDGEAIAPEKLAAALTALKESKPGAKLELEADSDTALGLLVKVWDALRAAGYSVNDVPARIERSESKNP